MLWYLFHLNHDFVIEQTNPTITINDESLSSTLKEDIDDDIKDYEINDDENTQHIDNIHLDDIDFPEDITTNELNQQEVDVLKEDTVDTKIETVDKCDHIEETNTIEATSNNIHETEVDNTELIENKETLDKEVVLDTPIEDINEQIDIDKNIELEASDKEIESEENIVETTSNTAVDEPEILKELCENPNEKSDLDLEIETDAEVNESGELVHAEVANVESELDDKEDSTEEPLGYFKTGKDVINFLPKFRTN